MLTAETSFMGESPEGRLGTPVNVSPANSSPAPIPPKPVYNQKATANVLDNSQDLKRREKELEAKEAELRKREQLLEIAQVPDQHMEYQVSKANNSQGFNDGTRLKAQWERHNVMILCDICKKEARDGNRQGAGVKKFSWKSIATKFASQTGLKYTGDQMKNKWDALKKDWKNWRTLKKIATGFGWNSSTKTIDASDEWWDRNIKVNPEIAKFRKCGIDPELEDILNALFSGTAKDDDMWAPSTGHPPTNFVEVSFSQENSSGQDVVYDLTNTEGFIEDLNVAQKNYIVEANEVEEENPQVSNFQSKKHPNDEIITNQKRKQMRKENEGASILSSKIDRVTEEIQNFTDIMKARVNRMPPTITEAVEILNSMEQDVPIACDLYRFATKLLLNKEKREMFVAMKKYSLRLWYLQAEAKDAGNESFTTIMIRK